MSCYGHAALLAARCARSAECNRIAACVSDRDGQQVCPTHALEELVADKSAAC